MINLRRGKISVRDLVEFVLRSGDIDNRRTSLHNAQEGARIHRKLQKEAGEDYQKEVFLKTDVAFANDSIQIEGRADGIYKNDTVWVIDEIKTSATAFEDLPHAKKELFFAQGMLYAYIYSQQNELSEIEVRLTYFQTTTEKITYEIRHFSNEELVSFLEVLMNEYSRWLVFQDNWRKVRNTSLEKLLFPYDEYRQGQRNLAVVAYKTLKTQKRLFVEAPTGTGKTISTLFPALKVLGEEQVDRIFYLTAKTITRSVAEDAFLALKDKGADLKSVTLTAKDKICFLDDRLCNPIDCRYANGYYDRINEALWDLLHHEDQMTREVIENYARKHTICPFELSLDVSLFCDLIIADYNYVFDPIVYLRRFFEEDETDSFFLVDEAHNLINRSREMYSASITDQIFVKLAELIPKKKRKVQTLLSKLISSFDLLKEQSEQEGWRFKHQQLPPEKIIDLLYPLVEQLQEILIEENDGQQKNQILPLYFDCIRFLKISEFYDDSYQTTIEVHLYKIIVKQFCMDPSHFLDASLSKGKGSLLFSASLSPLEYYQNSLGGGTEPYAYRINSPFPMANQAVLIANYIETTYTKRAHSLLAIVEALNMMIARKQGNYLVFFSSYQYLDQVAELFKKMYPEVPMIIQESNMSEEERTAFLDKFVDAPTQTLLGFCVLGGIFSEGIDLKGERLIGTAIVGVGLPQVNPEQELIKSYFSSKNNRGFEYAYQLPGMNKVLQAAGRVIRDATDQGVVLLLDTRFNSTRYRALFPQHWLHHQVCYQPKQLETAIDQFWLEKESKNKAF